MKLDKEVSARLKKALHRERAAVRLAQRERRHRERTQQELEEGQQFAKLINSGRNIDEILKNVMSVLGQRFAIESAFLTLVDKENNELFVDKFGPVPKHFTKDMVDYVSQIRLPLNSESGFVYEIFLRKRPFYMTRVGQGFWQRFDSEIIRHLDISSFLILPLIAQGEVFAMAFFTSYKKRMVLTRGDIVTITRLSNQIAGMVRTTYLLEQLQKKEKERERIRKELKKINDFSKEINASNNLPETLERIFAYLRHVYDLDGAVLFLLDKETNRLYAHQATEPESISTQALDFVRQFEIALDKDEGVFSKIWQRQKPLFAEINTLTHQSTKERQLHKTLAVKSFFVLPLVIRRQMIGLFYIYLYDHPWEAPANLSESQTRQLLHFGDHIAGPIHNGLLLTELEQEKKKSDDLLHTILPHRIADLLRQGQNVLPRFHNDVGVIFMDFAGFTKISESLTPNELVQNLSYWFEKFDNICTHYRVAPLKTMGDGYMAASGLLGWSPSHAVNLCLAALAMMEAVNGSKPNQDISRSHWNLRIGLHKGPVVSGILGKSSFHFDIWGDTVNLANRMESSGCIGKINVSEQMHSVLEPFFELEDRGLIEAKQKGSLKMFYVRGIRRELSAGPDRLVVNETFKDKYQQTFGENFPF